MTTPTASSLYAAAGSSATLLDSIFKTEAVGQILLMVNLTILAAGTFWLIWNVLAGITQSAWDGVVLGKRFHTLWMPIRNAIGIAMLIPAFGGWGAAQLILYQAAKMGAGAANIAVANGAGSFTAPRTADFAAPVNVDYFQVASRVLAMHQCREEWLWNTRKAQQQDAGQSGFDWTKFYTPSVQDCGKIDRIPAGALADTHMAATRTLDAALQPLAARVVAGGNDEDGHKVPAGEIEQTLRQAAQTYKTAIESASKTALESKFQQLNTTGQAGDWLQFGYKQTQAAAAAREINGATSKTAVMKGSKGEAEADATININPGDPTAGTENFSAATDVNGNAGSGMGIREFLSSLKNAPEGLLRWFLGGTNLQTLVGDGGDLIGALQAVGTSLLGLAASAIGALIALKVAAIWLGPVAISLIPAALTVTVIVFSIVIPLAVAGITLAAYLPLVPAIFWTLAVVGWLLTVAEALFMAPLWAFIHLETEGEGMGQKTEKGYAFIMNLVLRPLVLVFTFTVASLVLNAAWALLGSHIAGAIKAVDLVSFTGVFIFLGLCFALVTTAMAMVYKVYGTAIGLADAIPAWLGTNFHNYSSQWGGSDGFGSGGIMKPTRPGAGGAPGQPPKGGVDKPVAKDK